MYAPAPDYHTRPMTPDDRPVVAELDRRAFEQVRRQQGQLRRPLRLRTPDNLAAAFERPTPGVVIEAPSGQVAGYCFTHVWGTLGWLGTLGVDPEQQGTGLGQHVVAAGLDVLRAAGCRILALETMPESGKNLALYTRQGLEPRHLTLLCRGTPPPVSPTHFTFWQPGDPALREVTSSVLPGLDPTPAAHWLARENAGVTLVWHEAGRPSAFAALRTRARRQDGLHIYLTVEAAACHPDAEQHWPRYLREMHTYGRGLGKNGIVLPINAQHITLLRATLNAGMRIIHSRVRMAAGPAIGGPDARLVLTLAM